MKVAVAMSGGVDSSVSAAILARKGFEVVGITMRLWGTAADHESSVRAAADVCRMLGVSHRVVDLSGQFRKAVIENFLSEYVSGRTPNPCVRCNETIKFGALLAYAEQAGCVRLATGHYARNLVLGGTDIHVLMKGLDAAKEQSYFLYRLDAKQLARAMFPVGEMTKDEVRDLAHRLGLPNAGRSESQEVCFIPENDYRAFIRQELPQLRQSGNFVDTAGNVIGPHDGIAFYTIGQRRGLNVSSPEGRQYVIKRDPHTRSITLGSQEDLLKADTLVGGVRFVTGEPLNGPTEVRVRVRYRMREVKAVIKPEGENVRVVFSEPVSGISPGQSAVFYKGDRVLGGGIIIS